MELKTVNNTLFLKNNLNKASPSPHTFRHGHLLLRLRVHRVEGLREERDQGMGEHGTAVTLELLNYFNWGY
jgi:hypothetical protein